MEPDNLENTEGKQRSGHPERDLVSARGSASEPDRADDPQRPCCAEQDRADDPCSASLQTEVERSGGGDGPKEDLNRHASEGDRWRTAAGRRRGGCTAGHRKLLVCPASGRAHEP